jgi:hypothetical protein
MMYNHKFETKDDGRKKEANVGIQNDNVIKSFSSSVYKLVTCMVLWELISLFRPRCTSGEA